MDRLRIGILFSGEGTTAKVICDAVSHNILNIDISFLLTDSDRNSQDFEGYNLINLPDYNVSNNLLDKKYYKMY